MNKWFEDQERQLNETIDRQKQRDIKVEQKISRLQKDCNISRKQAEDLYMRQLHDRINDKNNLSK